MSPPAQGCGHSGLHVPPLFQELTLPKQIQKNNFPEGFMFGAATAAYQVEGAVDEGGKGATIWDTFTRLPGKIVDGSIADIAVDQYHRYKEDIELLADMGFDAYRFSISWCRVFPDGLAKSVNQEGIAHYNDVIDTLIEKGIQPVVTLYHWDLPQALQDSIGGWLSPEIVNHFANYAEVCFDAFGDRVKHWITLNEPLRFSFFGNGLGIHAPGRCSNRTRSPVGDSTTEPYIVGHNALLAHAAAVDIYNRKFKASQGGIIGISVDSEWAEPLTTSLEDVAAAQRHLEFHIGWFLDPIFFGDYPASMRERIGDRLPKFSSEEIVLLQNSLDFIGINHYTTRYIIPASITTENRHLRGWIEDINTVRLSEVDGKPIGDKGASHWMYIVPWGLHKLLNWTTKRYNRPAIFVTENGVDDEDCPSQSLAESLHDSKRVKFYQDYLYAVAAAVREGADVRGYFAWSLVDNFEWESGYTKRFGLIYVDYANNLKRYPKDSALWFTNFLRKDTLWKQKEQSVKRSLINDHISCKQEKCGLLA
eukprot:c27498_g1_i1 orf=501-2102(+)